MLTIPDDMKQPEAEETTFEPPAIPLGKTARADEECWRPSQAGPPASWRPAESRQRPTTEPGLDQGNSHAPETSRLSPETLEPLLNVPAAVLRLLKEPREFEKGLYQAVWEKYGPEANNQHVEKMEVLEALFNSDNLPVDMYPVMLQAYPDLFGCEAGRDRFLHYADATFSNLWNDIPD